MSRTFLPRMSEQKKKITPSLKVALSASSALFKEKFENRSAGLKTVTKSKSAGNWLNRKRI